MAWSATASRLESDHPAETAARVSILGATGSIGSSTTDLLARFPDRFAAEALVAHSDVAKLAATARRLRARIAVVSDAARYADLKDALSGSDVEAGAGEAAVLEAAARPADITVAAIAGVAGLAPTLAALGTSRAVALANKECLVAAGAMFMRRARERGTLVLPLDSEHNAVFQATAGRPEESIEKVTLTASGGPFRTWTKPQIAAATVEQALKHPNWSMGAKVTVDSATLMNKGLELIEAHHLFSLPADRLDVLVHPQSIVHALVSFSDGSVLAQLAVPDMRIPIACCLAWPRRVAWPAPRLDLAGVGNLTFESPDFERFPALALAQRALAAGGAAPTVLNAANEVAVAAFLQRRLTIPGIAALVEETLQFSPLAVTPETLEEVVELDLATRREAARLLPEIAAKAS